MKIEVISDVVCPWCFIGKRNLERALALWDGEGREPPQIEWLPFELNPDLPAEGTDRASYIAQKFGGPERAREIYARVSEAGRRAGLDFDFDRIVRQPNTFDAHRLIALADAGTQQDALVERLFRGYFLEGCDLTRHDVLADLAAESGLARERCVEVLAGSDQAPRVHAHERWAHGVGVSGVPFFVIDRRYGLSGAQPPEALVEAMREAATAAGTAASGASTS